MKIKFATGTNGGSVTIQREADDPKAKASGFTRQQHGWGAEIHLLGMLLQKLNEFGFNLCRAKVGKDGHMMGDDHMCYLRTPHSKLRKRAVDYPYMYIVDDQYAVRCSAKDYNKGKEVYFIIYGNVFSPIHPQQDWNKKVKAICDKHKIEIFPFCH